MNAVSNFEDSKSKPVMNSLALAFSNRVLEQEMAPFYTSTAQMSLNEGDTLEVLEGLFNAHLSGFEVTRNRLGTVMHVRTTVGQFENSINLSGLNYNNYTLGVQGSFAQTLVTLLRSEEKGQPYRMDIILNIPEEPVSIKKQNPDKFISHLKNVSSFASVLEGAGMPKKMISAGLAKGDSGFVDLYFYHYKPFNMYDKINAESEG